MIGRKIAIAGDLPGRLAVDEEMDVEARAVVMVDRAEHRLHPVAVAEERRDVADPQLAARSRSVAAGRQARCGAGRPGAATLQYRGVVGAHGARDDAGDAQQGFAPQRGVADAGGAAVAFDRVVDLAQLEQRLAQVEPRLRQIGTQRDGAAQAARRLAESIARQRGAAEAVPGVAQRRLARERTAVLRRRRREIAVELERVGVAGRQEGMIGKPPDGLGEGGACFGIRAASEAIRRPFEDRRCFVC